MKRLLLALALCLSASGIGALSAQTTDEDACMQKGGSLTDDGRCELSAAADIRVDYPLELAANAVVVSTIDPFIQQSKDDFLSSMEGAFSPAPGPYALDISYETVTHSDAVVSLVFTTYTFTGGAHGNTSFTTFTFDLNAGTVITLDDLFSDSAAALEIIAPLAEAQLTDHFDEIMPDGYDTEWLHQGISPDPLNYASFALDGDDLVFYFPPYQVAAYVAGAQSVRIPLADLSSVLAPAFAS